MGRLDRAVTPTCPRDGQPYQFDVETYRLSVE
jgi:hypothetical protein